jgi:hypothetical protein
MQTLSSIWETELRKLIAARIDALRDQLEANGYETVGEFRHVMGQISALRLMETDLIDEAGKRADQRNR